jgi:hypothetical protein
MKKKRAPRVTVDEVRKALEIVNACTDKSNEFVRSCRKIGFTKSYEKYARLAWPESYCGAEWCRGDITVPIADMLNFFTPHNGQYKFPNSNTVDELLRDYSASRMSTLIAKMVRAK